MNNFREAVLKAAQESGVSHVDMFRLRFRTLFPRVQERLESSCREQAVAMGMMTAVAAGSIDWMALLDFLKGLMTLILELISLL